MRAVVRYTEAQVYTALVSSPTVPPLKPYVYGASNPALRPVVPAGE